MGEYAEPVSPVSPISAVGSSFDRHRSSYGEHLHHRIDSPLPEPIKPPRAFKPTPRLYLAFLTVVVLTMTVALDGTSLSVALPIISMKIHGTAIEAFWSGTSFLLCSTVFQPSFASFSHIFGRKPMILTAMVFFTIGAIVCATSPNFTQLLVGRSLQGVGGGGIIALTEIVVTDLVPMRLRGKYFGFISGAWAVGSVSGPLVGGAFVEKVSWRWLFYLNLPILAIGFVFVPIFLRLKFRSEHLVQKLKRVDWIGAFLFVASTTSFLIPVTWGGVSYPWSSWRTLVPLTLGIAGNSVFIAWQAYLDKVSREHRGWPEPLIPLAIFQSRTAQVTYIGTILHGMILWSLLYYLPLYYEAVKGQTPVLAGVSLFPETFTTAPASLATGFIVAKTGRYRFSVWIGWILTTIGMGLLYLLDIDTSTAAWIFLNLIPGFGCGTLFAGLAFAIQASSTPAHLAWSVGMYSFFRAFGQALGVAIGGAIFQNQIHKKLLRYPATFSPDKAAEYSTDAAGLVAIIQNFGNGETKREIMQSYADSLKIIWVTMAGLAGVALILSIWTEGLDLNRPLETEQGFDRGSVSTAGGVHEMEFAKSGKEVER